MYGVIFHNIPHFWSKVKQNVFYNNSIISQPIALKFWILSLMTKPNKSYDTTPHLDPDI